MLYKGIERRRRKGKKWMGRLGCASFVLYRVDQMELRWRNR